MHLWPFDDCSDRLGQPWSPERPLRVPSRGSLARCVAGGFIDLVAEADLKPYDFCALAPVVEGAGGVMTDWQGHSLTLNSNGRVVAAGDKVVHGLALGALDMTEASRERA